MHIYLFNDLKFALKHLKSSYMFRSSHAVRRTTHIHNQAHSEQYTTHIVHKDILPQHQLNVTM